LLCQDVSQILSGQSLTETYALRFLQLLCSYLIACLLSFLHLTTLKANQSDDQAGTYTLQTRPPMSNWLERYADFLWQGSRPFGSLARPLYNSLSSCYTYH